MIKLFDTRIKDDNSPCPINAGDFIRVKLISGYENLAYVVDVTYEENENDPYDNATLEVLFPSNLNSGDQRNKPGSKFIGFREIVSYSEASQEEFNNARDEYMKNYAREHREHLNALKRESAERIKANKSDEERAMDKQKKSEYDQEHQRYSSLKRMYNKAVENGQDTSDIEKMLNREIKKTGVNPKK